MPKVSVTKISVSQVSVAKDGACEKSLPELGVPEIGTHEVSWPEVMVMAFESSVRDDNVIVLMITSRAKVSELQVSTPEVNAPNAGMLQARRWSGRWSSRYQLPTTSADGAAYVGDRQAGTYTTCQEHDRNVRGVFPPH